MATIKIVPQEDWEIVRKYIYADSFGAVVLVPEEKLKEFPKEQANALRSHDCGFVGYDFGGEPDFYIDVVNAPNCFCAEEIINEIMGAEKDAEDC